MKALTQFWAFILVLSCGILIGILVKYPAGWRLPGSTANFLGSVVGALATISGAFLVMRRQFSEAERVRSEERDEQTRQAKLSTKNMIRAVANALSQDLIAARRFCRAQCDLVDGKFVNGHSMRTGADQKAWCERQARLPMVAFERFAPILTQLGVLSPMLVRIYADGARLSAIMRGYLDTGASPFPMTEMIPLLKEQLEMFIQELDAGIDMLKAHTVGDWSQQTNS